MAISSQTGDDDRLPPKKSTVLLLLTIADTTWRLFIPIIGLMLGGLWLDVQSGTKPWLMVVGIVLGTSIAVWLVWAQIKKVKKV